MDMCHNAKSIPTHVIFAGLDIQFISAGGQIHYVKEMISLIELETIDFYDSCVIIKWAYSLEDICIYIIQHNVIHMCNYPISYKRTMDAWRISFNVDGRLFLIWFALYFCMLYCLKSFGIFLYGIMWK